MTPSGRHAVLGILLLLLLLLVHSLALLMGCFFLISSCNNSTAAGSNRTNNLAATANKATIPPLTTLVSSMHLTRYIMRITSAARLREHLRQLTSEPHVAGTMEANHTAAYVTAQWRQAGWDHVFTKYYNVLLDYPEKDEHNLPINRFSVLNQYNHTIFQGQRQEQPLEDQDADPRVVPPYLAYAPSGLVTGRVVYANYGQESDFDYLQHNLSIHLNGSIALIRYGIKGRGEKLQNAARAGCIGALLFGDPDVWAPPNMVRVGKTINGVYPDGWWLPFTGVQRGSALLGSGDPATQDYPAVSSAWRSSLEEMQHLMPPIPGMPISYGDAHYLLQNIKGASAPPSWQGGLMLNYSSGLGPMVRLQTAHKKSQRIISNIFAELRGNVEPQKYVLIGNHRDAWAFGAIDPGSGTAVILELASVLGKLVQHYGWRPRRSILLCSWDAEEFGLIGSQEWVEEEKHRLQRTAVAYINVDIAVRGNFSIGVSASPLIRRVIAAAMDAIPAPAANDASGGSVQSLWQQWRHPSQTGTSQSEGQDKGGRHFQHIQTPTHGSDYAAFLHLVGLPVADFSYVQDPQFDYFYALYHSRYETFSFMEKTVDPGFLCHQAVTQLVVEVVRRLAEPAQLPFDLRELSTDLLNRLKAVASMVEINKKLPHAVGFLRQAIDTLSKSTKRFLTRSFEATEFNDRLLSASQTLLTPLGAPLNPRAFHLLYGASQMSCKATSQAMTAFPALRDLLCAAKNSKQKEKDKAWQQIDKYIRVIVHHVNMFAKQLQESFAPN